MSLEFVCSNQTGSNYILPCCSILRREGYPTPTLFSLYYIILYCSSGADEYPKKFLLLYIYSYFIVPPPCGGELHLWDVVNVRKYVIIYLMREYCLMVKQLSFKQPMLGSIPAILITPPIISPAPLRGERGSDKSQLLIT